MKRISLNSHQLPVATRMVVLKLIFFGAFVVFANDSKAHDPLKREVPLAATHKRSKNFLEERAVIEGKVVSANGDPLSGVSVTIKGTTTGATTDQTGYFRIDAKPGDILEFSYVGYQAKQIAVSDQLVLNVTMDPSAKEQDTLVFVGYGTQRRASVTASIASVPMKQIKDMPVSNVAAALQGKVPGVLVQQNNGAPGSTPAIKVRGFGSVSAGTNPLIVVDGNIVSPVIFGTLNSNEIESIDVLKDASSAAIYGSRGANGVLIVTTKRGKPGPTKIDVNVYAGFQQVAKKLKLLNSQQFAEFSKEAANNAYLDNVPAGNASDPNNVRPSSYLRYRYPRGDLFEWFNFDDPQKVAALPTYDYQDLIFRTAKLSNYQLTVSGGNDKVLYLVSGGYLKQDGIIEKSTLDRYSMRVNVDVHAASKLKFGFNLNPSYRKQQEVNSDGTWSINGIVNSALASVPMASIYNADSSAYSSQTALAAPYNWPGITNPVANIKEYNSEYVSTYILGNAYAQYDLMKNLKYRLTGNVYLNQNRRNTFRTSKMPLNQLLPPTAAIGTAFSDQNLSWLVNQTLNYNKTFFVDHDVEVLVGTETYKLQYQSSNATGTAFANDIVQTLNAAGTPGAVGSFRSESSTISYFARLRYSYKNRYLLNASIRRDGASVFGPDNRWGTFPAASIGWHLSEEPFMQRMGFLSEAKLRVTYGLAGNNAFSDPYPYVASISPDNYVLGNRQVTGLAPSSLGNAQLGWEKSNQVDAGVDLGFFNNRIFIIADYYRRITKDLLLAVNIPTVTGFSTTVQNIGKMRNEGWEFAVTTRNLTKALSWSTTINVSTNDNKVLALGPTGDPIIVGTGTGETNITRIGDPIGSYYGYKMIGIFQNAADLAKYPHDATAHPGDVIFADINGDGKIDAKDRTAIGNNQPDFVYGFTNTFSYKNIDLSIAIQGVEGSDILNLSRRFIDNLEGNANQLTTALSRWQSPDNPGDGKTPRANERVTGNNNAISSRWVEDGSYLRIQNITLGYRMPDKILSKTGMQEVRIYISTQNPYTKTKYLGYNPEVSGYEGPLTGGVDYGYYPLAKTFTMGVNLGF